MLTIRKEQMEVLSAYMRQGFEDRMLKHFAEVFPERYEKAKEEEYRLLIRSGIEKAASYEVRDEHSVALFLDLMMGDGPDFDQLPAHAWMRTILTDKSLSGSAKMQLIYERLSGKPAGVSSDRRG